MVCAPGRMNWFTRVNLIVLRKLKQVRANRKSYRKRDLVIAMQWQLRKIIINYFPHINLMNNNLDDSTKLYFENKENKWQLR